MNTWVVVLIVLAVVLGVVAVVVAVVFAARSRREAGARSELRAGVGSFQAAPDGAALLQRLGMAGLVAGATDAVTWQVGERDAVAARTDGRGWAVTRGQSRTRTTISGVTYTLVAVRLPGSLPTINVLRDGVIGSSVEVESGAFNDARDIRTDDDRVAHAVLTPRVIALLQDLPQDLTVQIVGDHVISFRRGAPSVEAVLQRAELLAGIADAIPAFVYSGRTESR